MMILSNAELIKRSEVFDDSRELAGALREMAEDDVISQCGQQVYYLKECAEHIDGLYEHAMALTRALAGKQRRPVEAAVRPELVTDLRMSRRPMNCLLAANIERIEQVTELSEIDLLRLPNLGKGSVLEISTALAIVGLSLRPAP